MQTIRDLHRPETQRGLYLQVAIKELAPRVAKLRSRVESDISASHAHSGKHATDAVDLDDVQLREFFAERGDY